ncbi:MAG: B12-binding domain-containing radical SAM protein [Desulfobacca sp.]|uniref:B12-binding domain-containing radical SAM protein n=1 Tax=Desulfobacca sp. TaxID=2067990 RepID=UPI00404B6E04
MNILLIEAPYDYGRMESMTKPHFPLGLGYVAAYLRQQGHTVRLLIKLTPEELQRHLEAFDPQLVGVSCMTPTFPQAVAICRTVKEKGRAATVLGGPHVTALKEDILALQPEVDYVVYGEGEQTVAALCQALAQGNPALPDVNGLVYRRPDGTISVNPPRGLIKDVDSLPFPARDLLDMERLGTHRYIDVGRNSATMISSRGCPFKCAFCSSHITMGKLYRFRSAENVLAEIDELVGRYRVNHIAFEDDTFTLNRERLETICQELIRRCYDLTWYCLSRVESMDLELARLMRRAGCRLVSFGIESGNPEILQKIHKKISLPAARRAVEACYRAGLRSQCTFILGFPFDTQQTMAETLRFAQELSPTIAIFFALVPYPGTEMYRYLPESLRPQRADEWQDFANMINNQGYLSLVPGVSAAALTRMTEQWHLRFYLRPRQLYRMFRTLHSWQEFRSFAASGWGLAQKVSRVLLGRN